MLKWLVPPSLPGSLYPDDDGKRWEEGTKHARWMTLLMVNLSGQFMNQEDVFVAMNLLWYAQEGEPTVRQDPDVMVSFGRPKGERGSYRQWLEGGIAPQVVFEILTPGLPQQEISDKYRFYEEHGVEEYYAFTPDTNVLEIYLRQGEVFRRVRESRQWISPRLGIRFDLTRLPMEVYSSAGEQFLPFEQMILRHRELKAENRKLKENLIQSRAELERSKQQRLKAQQELELSKQELEKERQELELIKQQCLKAQQELELSKQELEKERQALKQIRQERDRVLQLVQEIRKENELLREKLRQLGIDPDMLGV